MEKAYRGEQDNGPTAHSHVWKEKLKNDLAALNVQNVNIYEVI